MPTARRSRTSKVRASPVRGYHHGDLRQALVTAGLALIEAEGAEALSVREVARRAGVSSAAPFRHFPSRIALMTAIAEEAMRRFHREFVEALEKAPTDDPLARFRAIGIAYLRWAFRNPTHFQVLSDRTLFDFEGATELRRQDQEIRLAMEEAVKAAIAKDRLRSDDVRLLHLTGRGLVYGLARMQVDGHMPRWGVAEHEAQAMAEKALDLLAAGLAKPA
ncbi:MAG: TetR/AcrR family transcriptional regulator [Alphaproteobacteria bacterium]|nr:TetR/AcrR family transcriptional regulator [Alphaproteobacteria bacterium]